MHRIYRIIAAGTILFTLIVLPTAAQVQNLDQQARNLVAVTIISNVRNAAIFVNGTRSAQTTPAVLQLAAGKYSITVAAPGYGESTRDIAVTRPVTVSFDLQPAGFGLSVQSNIKGAQVYLNGSFVGVTPYSAVHPAGTYTVRVTASGYTDYQTQVTLSRDAVVNAVLRPSLAQVRFSVPINIHSTGGRPASAWIRLSIDGVDYPEPVFTLPAGQHLVRITMGSLYYEQLFVFDPGASYLISPFIGVSVLPQQNQ